MSATTDSDCSTGFMPIRRVTLRLRAGMSGFEVEPDLRVIDPLLVPTAATQELHADPRKLLALRVRDQGMEPMLFEDDWIVIDTSDTVRRAREVYALNWNGEACIAQLVERGGQWFMSYLNPDFHPINIRSGQLNIVGRAVYQPGRAITGRL
jgi:phage repressor protein C with HTH and peptisase S24 domain